MSVIGNVDGFVNSQEEGLKPGMEFCKSKRNLVSYMMLVFRDKQVFWMGKQEESCDVHVQEQSPSGQAQELPQLHVHPGPRTTKQSHGKPIYKNPTNRWEMGDALTHNVKMLK